MKQQPHIAAPEVVASVAGIGGAIVLGVIIAVVPQLLSGPTWFKCGGIVGIVAVVLWAVGRESKS